jgi:hypothetical protein
MATFSGLFDFPNYGLSDDQSELSSPPDSDDESTCSERTEEQADEWYNIPSDSDESDDDTPAPTFTLPLRSAVTSTAFTIVKPIKKEHTTGARIKAIYMLNEKQPWAKILAITGISKSRVYALAAVARERG